MQLIIIIIFKNTSSHGLNVEFCYAKRKLIQPSRQQARSEQGCNLYGNDTSLERGRERKTKLKVRCNERVVRVVNSLKLLLSFKPHTQCVSRKRKLNETKNSFLDYIIMRECYSVITAFTAHCYIQPFRHHIFSHL